MERRARRGQDNRPRLRDGQGGEVRDYIAEFIIEPESFDMIGDEGLAVKVTIFGDAVELLASGRLVRGLRNIREAKSLDVVEAGFALAGLPEVVALSEGGKPRVVEHGSKPSKKEAERDGAALVILGAALLDQPAIMGAANDRGATEIRETIKRANEVAVCLGYPENMVKGDEIQINKGRGGSAPPAPGSFYIGGGDPNTVH